MSLLRRCTATLTVMLGTVTLGLLSFAAFAQQLNIGPDKLTPRTDSLFTISGFVPQLANTPAELRHLHALPPDKLITRTRNGKTVYLYADPTICRCVYVGTPEAYRTYQNGGPEGYVGDEDNTGSPRFNPRVLEGEMADDPYINDPAAPSLDDYLFRTP